MISSCSDQRALAHHRIHPSIVINTLWATSRQSPPGYPIASPSREDPSTFMEPLSWLMHTRSAAPHTPLHGQGLTLFRSPYPMATSPANTPSTNPSASCASCATRTILSGTASTDACTTHTSCTSSSTTTVLWPSLSPRWIGADA